MRNSKARCMEGWDRSPQLFRCERSSMPPGAAHDKFADWLTCPRRQLRLAKIFGKSLRIARITNGDGRNGIPAVWNTESLARFVVREAGHLVNEQAPRGGLGSQLRVGGTDVVYGHRIWRAIVSEVPA